MSVVRLLVLCTVMAPVLSFAARGDYGGGLDPALQGERESEAVYYYKKGLEEHDDAREYEEKAAEYPKGHDQYEDYMEEAREAYEDAIDEYKVALNHDNRLYPAHAGLGYALRKVGKLRESEIAYQNALFIKPDYAPAIEYLAETHLQMRRYDAVKAAYRKLLELEPGYARQLSQAVEDWLQEQAVAGDPELEQFAEWSGQAHAVTGQHLSP